MQLKLIKLTIERENKIIDILKLLPDFDPAGYTNSDLDECYDCAKAGIPLPGEENYIPYEQLLRMQKCSFNAVKTGNKLAKVLQRIKREQ